jgi:hypothetical protein
MKAVVIATGPSLKEDQVKHTIGRVDLTIAVNDAIFLVPWADILYSGDNRWWNYHGPYLEWFQGERLCAARDNEYSTKIEGIGGLGPYEKEHIRFGNNSGFAAVNVALNRGASTIYLLGYDMGTAAGQQRHYFGDHPSDINIASPYESFRKQFDIAAPSLKSFGAEVINCTEGGFLECFPKAKITEVL